MRRKLLSAFLCLLTATGSAQVTTRLTGVVRDMETHEALPYAIVRIEGTAKGTTTDRTGRFSLILANGAQTMVVSQVGYKSARRLVEAGTSAVDLSFELAPAVVELPEVVITPAENPAIAIIRLAIENKKNRKQNLKNYTLTSHSKVVVNVSDMKGLAVNSLEDTAFTAILETHTDAFWEQPDKYKEIIKARKQSAFIPAQSNIIISGFFITDFSADVLDVSDGARVVGPISDAGLKNYQYTLAGTSQLEGTRIFVIDISPQSDVDPLLKGTIWISEGAYALTKVDVELNDAAKPAFFTSLRYKQNFGVFDGGFWMPVDVVVSAQISISMIVQATIRLDAFSVLQDYAINREWKEEPFDRKRIQVLKEADTRDTLYWAQHQAIPNSQEEINEYRKSDSMKVVFDARRNRFGVMDLFAGKKLSVGQTTVPVPGVFDVYRFNRVEGHSLHLPLAVTTSTSPAGRIAVSTGYGFADKRWKSECEMTVEVLDGKRLTLNGSLFDRLGRIDEDEEVRVNTSTTLSSLLLKYDEKDYYYVKGWQAGIRSDIGLMFPSRVYCKEQSYYSATRMTNWSIGRPSWAYRENPAVNEGSIATLGVTLSYDGRDLIDNAGVITRFGESAFTPALGFEQNWGDIGSQKIRFTVFSASARGTVEMGRPGTTTFRIGLGVSSGAVPVQRIFNLPGSIPYDATKWRFRTLDFREFGGDKKLTLFIEHDFGDQLFRWLEIPFLKGSGWRLILFGGGGWTTISGESRALRTIPLDEAKFPFYEAGVGLDKVFTFFRIDVAWRLSHLRNGRNFFFGISTPLLN